MKKYIIGVIAFVAVFGLSIILYQYLSNNYNTEETSSQSSREEISDEITSSIDMSNSETESLTIEITTSSADENSSQVTTEITTTSVDEETSPVTTEAKTVSSTEQTKPATTTSATTKATTTPITTTVPEETKPILAENTTADFTVLNKDGDEVKLSDYFGKPIVVNFWATWCGPCKSELPAFDKAYKEYGDKIEFLMVNLTDGSWDTISSVNQFVSDGGYTFPVYFDTEYSASDAYNIYSIPETIFIAADGTLSDSQIGALSESSLTKKLDNLL